MLEVSPGMLGKLLLVGLKLRAMIAWQTLLSVLLL